jgi:hypothetical protein
LAESSGIPAFARRLQGETEEDRLSVLEDVHPDYAANLNTWEILLDAFEGSGGFQSGEYLWRYRNETGDDYVGRKAMARYHNYVEQIVDIYVRHAFSQTPKRQAGSETLKAFWEDVDGAGTHIDAYMKRICALALVSGHVGTLMDMTPELPAGQAKVDQKARPFLATFTAPAITDWRLDRNTLTGIKLIEDVVEVDISVPHDPDNQNFLLWDEEGWARFNQDGEFLDGDTPGLERVPFAVLRPKPSILRDFLGRPLFGNANVVKALFNRWSEEDEVLRNQGFSTLVVDKLPETTDVSDAKKQFGNDVGTNRVLFAKGEIKYVSPEMAIPEGLAKNIAQIIKEMFRVTHQRWQPDSLMVQSAEAIRLQYTELNEMLHGLVQALQEVDLQLARFYFAWTESTPEAADAAFEAADISIEYADEFFLDDLKGELDVWASAMAMDLGETFEKRLKKRAVRRLDPEMPPDELDAIDKEIDALLTVAQKEEKTREEDAALVRERFAGAGPQES